MGLFKTWWAAFWAVVIDYWHGPEVKIAEVRPGVVFLCPGLGRYRKLPCSAAPELHLHAAVATGQAEPRYIYLPADTIVRCSEF